MTAKKAPKPRNWGVDIAAALQVFWVELQRAHPEIPEVVLITGSGYQGKQTPRNGHFWPGHWNITEEVTKTKEHPPVDLPEGIRLPAATVTTTADENRGLPEVFIAGERIAQGGMLVAQTIIHEAAHALGHVREEPTTSQGGRYHTKTFARFGEELGLVKPVKADKSHGFAFMDLSEEAAELWKPWYEAFDNLPNLKGNLLLNLGRGSGGGGSGGETGAGRNGKRFAVACQCVPARRIQVSPKTFESGALLCGVCDERFEEAL